MKPVLCVGISTLDCIFYHDNLPKKSGKHPAKSLAYAGGGPAANASVCIARLGGRTQLLTPVAQDKMSQNIVQELEDFGVEVIQKVIAASSSVSAVFVDKAGERLISNYRDNNLDGLSTLAKHNFAQYGCVLADVRYLNLSLEVLSHCHKLGIPTILDADITEEPIEKLFNFCDWLVFSKAGFLKVCNRLKLSKKSQTAMRTLWQRYSVNILITDGERGIEGYVKQKHIFQEAFKVKPVDTTAAGDVFHGAFAWALAKGYDIEKNIRFSSAAAALKCLGKGREAFASLESVENFLNSYAKK